MALTDKLRAAVFARDKGICAFSGLSVWYLDHGTSPFSHPDWPDHIRPVSRGGKDELDNLVCASFFHNRKKLNNGADTAYLFKYGRPTDVFFWNYGSLSEEQASMLRTHQALQTSDWYFNRALFNIFVALGDECSGATVKRDRRYWIESARKRLAEWQRLTEGTSAVDFIRRGLVRYPDAPDVKLMLSLTARDIDIDAVYRRLRISYAANMKAYDTFLSAATEQKRQRFYDSAKKTGRVTRPLLEVMKRNLLVPTPMISPS
jgi:hypothetical protein